MNFSLGPLLVLSGLCNYRWVVSLWTMGAVRSFSPLAKHDRNGCHHSCSNGCRTRERLRSVRNRGSRSSLEAANNGQVHTPRPANTKAISMPVRKQSWEVWKTIARLEEILQETDPSSNTETPLSSLSPLYPASQELVATVRSILLKLATRHDGEESWKGVLNKSTLLHEVEESILAIHFLQQQLSSSLNHNQQQQQQQQPREIVLVDVCCGKGVFSLLASYVFERESESSNSCGYSIRKIIMMDKDPNLRWDHIDSTNRQNGAIGNSTNRPAIECWPRYNVHDIDDVVDRLAREVDNSSTSISSNDNNNNTAQVALDTKASPLSSLAMVGIHLCKTLSPSCIGIANALGPEKCSYLVLAPCCLPRVVVQSQIPDGKPRLLQVRQHETPEQRHQRHLAKERRAASMVRGKGRATTNNTVPLGACWKCGEFGHTKANCPSNQSTGKPKLIQPLAVSLDVSEILSKTKPFGSYCDLLATSIQRSTVVVQTTALTNSHSSKKKPPNKQQTNNWNRDRKSVYIVASETVGSAPS